jgi:hypothetical protein
MTFLVADRVQETTNSPGTGTATLLGAVSGYQSFSTGIGANNTTFYVIADQLGTNWEVGLGALNATGTVLTRTTVYSSSNGGSTVNFATGTQFVWCDFPSSKSVIQGTAVNFSSIGATTAGTGAFTTLSATSTVSGAGFSNYFAAPPTIGSTTPNAGTFTALVATSITDSGLTAGRVNYNGVGGLLQDSANMVFDGFTLTTLNSAYTGTLTGGTGIVNLGSGQFYKDASGNVGIGTSSPSAKFHVLDTAGNMANFISSANGGGNIQLSCTNLSSTVTGYIGANAYTSNVWSLGSASSTPVSFYVNATERMRIDSSGNLGVNTSSPRNKLTVNGAISGISLAISTGALATNYFPFTMNTNQTYMVFVSWNGGGGYALCLISGSIANGAVVIASSNASGGNNSFDTTNNGSSNGGNGVSMFYNGGYLIFQLKSNFTAAGTAYFNIFGM